LHAIQNFRRRRCRTLLAIERFTETLFHQPLANILNGFGAAPKYHTAFLKLATCATTKQRLNFGDRPLKIFLGITHACGWEPAADVMSQAPISQSVAMTLAFAGETEYREFQGASYSIFSGFHNVIAHVP
jgi:hypothetical protein